MDILIVDDHPLLRAGLWCLLEQCDGLSVVGAAADGAQALELAERLRPDLVLMDICMPGLDGLETTRRLRRSASPPAVVMLTSSCTPALVQDAFDAGAEGYLLKDTPADTLVDLLRGLEQGGRAMDPRAARSLARLHAASEPRSTADLVVGACRRGQGLSGSSLDLGRAEVAGSPASPRSWLS